MKLKKILVTYATMSGSTADVARAIAEELAKGDIPVDVLPLAQVSRLEDYTALILGAPMIMGWHRAARAFLRKNRKALQNIPLAVFVTAMSLTANGEQEVHGVPVFLDGYLARPPGNPGRLSLKERYTQLGNYAVPILKAAMPARPVSIAFFGGRLDLFRLPWWAKIFVLVVVQSQPGDRRDWDAIRSWAGEILSKLK